MASNGAEYDSYSRTLELGASCVGSEDTHHGTDTPRPVSDQGLSLLVNEMIFMRHVRETVDPETDDLRPLVVYVAGEEQGHVGYLSRVFRNMDWVCVNAEDALEKAGRRNLFLICNISDRAAQRKLVETLRPVSSLLTVACDGDFEFFRGTLYGTIFAECRTTLRLIVDMTGNSFPVQTYELAALHSKISAASHSARDEHCFNGVMIEMNLNPQVLLADYRKN